MTGTIRRLWCAIFHRRRCAHMLPDDWQVINRQIVRPRSGQFTRITHCSTCEPCEDWSDEE